MSKNESSEFQETLMGGNPYRSMFDVALQVHSALLLLDNSLPWPPHAADLTEANVQLLI